MRQPYQRTCRPCRLVVAAGVAVLSPLSPYCSHALSWSGTPVWHQHSLPDTTRHTCMYRPRTPYRTDWLSCAVLSRRPYHAALASHPDPTLPCGVTERCSLRELESY